jgi:hypothetical protein
MNTEKIDHRGRKVVAVSSNLAWKLCGKDLKSAPYAGYAVELNSGNAVSCVREQIDGGKSATQFYHHTVN